MIYIFIKRRKLPVTELFELSKKQISDLFKTDLNSVRLLKEPGGKPYLENCGLFVSGAHSGEYTVLAVGEKPLGVDVEAIRDIDYYMLAKRLFPNYDINNQTQFFKMWSAYEAVTKRLPKINLAIFDDEQPSLTYFNKIEGYMMAVSSEDKEFTFVVE